VDAFVNFYYPSDCCLLNHVAKKPTMFLVKSCSERVEV